MTVKIHVGSEIYEVPVPKFRLLKKAWPFIAKMQAEGDVMDKADLALNVIAVFVSQKNPEVTVEYLEDNLEVSQMSELINALPSILIEAGVLQAPGEAQKPEESLSP